MRFLRILSWLIVGIALLSALLLGGGYIYLSSQRGLDRLAPRVAALASSDGQIVNIDGVKGRLFSDLSIAEVTVADGQGVWLQLHGLHLIWQPWNLINHHPPVALVAAQQVTLIRLPKTPPSAEQKPASSPLSLKKIAAYLPRTLMLGEVWIHSDVAGVEQRLTVVGKGDAARYAFQIKTVAGPETSLDASIVPQTQDLTLQLGFAEAPAGIVGALLGLPNDISLSAQAHGIANLNGAIQLQNAQITAGTMVLQASGQYDPAEARMAANATVHAPDITLLQAISGTPMNGSLEAAVSLVGTLQKLDMSLTLESPQLMIDGTGINALHSQATLRADVDAWGTDRFTAGGSLQTTAKYQLQQVSLATNLTIADSVLTLDRLAAAYGDNTLSGHLRAKGTPAAFDLTSALALATPYGASTLTLDGTVDTATQKYHGKAAGKFTYLKETFDLATDIDATAERAQVTNLKLRGPGTDLSGDLTVHIPEQLVDGTLNFNAPNLTPLGHLVRVPLAGTARAIGNFSTADGKQRIEATAHAEKLQADTVHIGQLDFKATAVDAKTLDRLDASITLQKLVADTVRVDRLTAKAQGSLQQGLALTWASQGMVDRQPWALTVAAQAQQPNDQRTLVTIKTLDGTYAQSPLRLQAPSTLLYTPTRSELSPLALALAGGTVKASGIVTPQTVTGDLSISHVALDRLPTLGLPKGTVDATATLRGTAQTPVVAWNGTSTLTLDAHTLALSSNGRWKQKTLDAAFDAHSDEAKASATLTLDTPLTLLPFSAGITDYTALRGQVKAHLPLTMLNAQLRASGQRLSGVIDGETALMGTLGTPSFNGRFTLDGGTYDQADTGICLRDMNATLSGSQQAVRLEHFSATDSNKHALTAEGTLGLKGSKTLSAAANFNDFRLFCGGLASGNVDGKVNASGTLQAMSVGGKITLGPLNVQIPGNRAASDIPSVPISWVKQGETLKSAKAKPSVVALNINLHAPGQLFVRGRGLDAEFLGDLAITGTTTTPMIVGELERRRGKFTLFDRVLTLNTATLRFEGPIPPSPYLDVTADTLVNGTTVTVGLNGTALKPALTLTSTPALPQDELLALLLFGRQLDKISPFQALKLAQATRTLAGIDDGPGVLGNIRNTLGLDTLDVGTDAENNPNVSTGKYVTDKVYVGVSQGATPEDRKVTTEINLSTSVSGKTSVDAGGNQSVGFDWKHDY